MWMKAGVAHLSTQLFFFKPCSCNSPFHPASIFMFWLDFVCLVLFVNYLSCWVIDAVGHFHFQEKIKLHRNALDFTGRDSEVLLRFDGLVFFHALLMMKRFLLYQSTLNIDLWSKEIISSLIFCAPLSFHFFKNPKYWRKTERWLIESKELLLLNV